MIYFKCSNPADIAALNLVLRPTAVPFPASFIPCIVRFDNGWSYTVLDKYTPNKDLIKSIYDAAPHAVDIPLYHPELLI